jgi:signal transduction histidine kinase
MPSSDAAPDQRAKGLTVAGRALGAAAIGVAAFEATHLLAGPLDGLFFSIPLTAVFLSGLLGSTWTALVTMAAFSGGAVVSMDPHVSGVQLAHTVETYKFVGFLAVGFIAAGVSGRVAAAYARSREAHARALRAAEEAARARRELERVMAVVGHDLRSPLQALQMNTALLLRTPELPPRQRTAVERMAGSCTRMARLIADLVDVGRALRGDALPLERRTVELAGLCRQVATELQDAHPRASVSVDAPGEVLVEADPDRIMQAVANLVGNALQHGSADRPVDVAIRRRGHEALVSVHNFGPPIAPASAASIFDPFKRGGAATAGAMRGSVGLGLFIARQITVAHGGDVAVDSDAARGTTFTLTLPALQVTPRDLAGAQRAP